MKKFSYLLYLMLLAACAAQEPQSQAHWQISAQYVADTMLKSDAAIREALREGEIERLTAQDLPSGVHARYRRMAKNMRLRPLPALYLNTQDTRALPQAAARFSKSGRAMVLLNTAALDAWTPRELAAVLGHELAHLKARDVTAENLARAYNRPEISVANELAADKAGSGPLGSCNPEALKDALQKVYAMDITAQPADGFDTLTGTGHPAHTQRLAALDAMAESPPTGCR